MNRTPIEWCRTYAADGSFEEGFSVNPVRFLPHGKSYPNGRLVTMCQKVSPGCTHCYAETITRRFWPKDAAVPFPGYTAAGVAAGEFVLDERTLLSVLRRKKPARIFWGDMTDLFQKSVPDAFLDRCFAVCALTPHLTHMFLTKRTERYLEYFSGDMGRIREALIGCEVSTLQLKLTGSPVSEWSGLPMPNVWLGTSVENQETADLRIPLLLKTPAAVRFISAEPLLGPVDALIAGQPALEHVDGEIRGRRKLDWVIVGGESGPGARPMHPDWARSLRDQCNAAGVPFFFKQWGEWGPYRKDQNQYGSPALVQTEAGYRKKCTHVEKGDGTHGYVQRVGTKAAGCLLDGVEHHDFPAVTA